MLPFGKNIFGAALYAPEAGKYPGQEAGRDPVLGLGAVLWEVAQVSDHDFAAPVPGCADMSHPAGEYSGYT